MNYFKHGRTHAARTHARTRFECLVNPYYAGPRHFSLGETLCCVFQSGESLGRAADTASPSRGQLADVDDAMDNLGR